VISFKCQRRDGMMTLRVQEATRRCELAESMDREWRCMVIAIYLYRYIEHVSQQMRGTEERITLTTLADYLEADLVSGCHEEFVAWKFAIEKSPEILREIAGDLGAIGFDKMLAKGESVPVVLMMANDILRMEDGKLEGERPVC
jgi:hypothetical protein